MAANSLPHQARHGPRDRRLHDHAALAVCRYTLGDHHDVWEALAMATLQEERKDQHDAIRAAIRDICKDFPDAYWRDVDQRHEYPDAFVRALTEAGWLACLIPEEYGGAGLGITEASLILEELNRSGANSAACHAQ